MNYQYNQPGQPPMYGQNPMNARRKAALEELADKMAAFFSTNTFLGVIARGSHIVAYIVTGIGFLIATINLFLGAASVPLGVIALMFGVLSVSKRSTLPLAVALTYVSLFELISIIFSLVYLVNLSNQYTFDMGYALSLVFSFLVGLVEFALLAVSTVISWIYFAASLPPKAYQPYVQPPYGQVPPPPPQQYGQQVPPQQYPQQAPPQNYQQPPAAPPQPAPAPQPQGKVCPVCGVANEAEAGFCKGCGTKLG